MIIPMRVLCDSQLNRKCERERNDNSGNIFMRERFYCLYAVEMKFSCILNELNKTKQNKTKWINEPTNVWTNNEWIFRCAFARRVYQNENLFWDWNLRLCTYVLRYFPVYESGSKCNGVVMQGDRSFRKKSNGQNTVWRDVCTNFKHFSCLQFERAFHSNRIGNLK